MSLKKRLQKLAAKVQAAGVNGESMQDKLASIIQAEDLSPHEVRRIAEMANRGVQLELSKVAEDKRFKFELCDAGKAVKFARKVAEASTRNSEPYAKLASAIEEAGGDPFAPIGRADGGVESLSLINRTPDAKIAFADNERRTREMLFELDRTRLELEAMQKEAQAAKVESYGKASDANDRAVQSAVDLLIGGGIKLPDLYMAIRAACGGSRADKNAGKVMDNLTLLIINGVKSRGVKNHQLGFRFKGDIDALDALSDRDLLALAKRTAGDIGTGPESTDISILTEKRAHRYVETVNHIRKATDTKGHPFEDAAALLHIRQSVSDHPQPDGYLDDAVVGNTPGGKVRVVDGDHEFIIGIQDLVGEQARLTRLHNADEYIGLKLKQIENSMRTLQDAQKMAATEYEEKMAAAGLVMNAAKGLGKSLGAMPTADKVSLGIQAAPLAAAGVGKVVDTVTPKKRNPQQQQQGAPV